MNLALNDRLKATLLQLGEAEQAICAWQFQCNLLEQQNSQMQMMMVSANAELQAVRGATTDNHGDMIF
eukprot:7278346-Karenia_brevis.AAC.1